MSAETPGPWVASPTGERMRDCYSQPWAVAQWIEGGRATDLVAGCFGDTMGGSKAAEANARLMASAPELRDALRDILDDAWANETRPYIAARALLARLDGGA